jgi:hypothetical protein
VTTKPAFHPEIRIGQVKTFGTEGPAYEVTGLGQATDTGEWLVPIRVILSGEELGYPFSQFALDPEAV